MTAVLTLRHQQAQIANGATAAALVMEFAEQFRTGRLSRDDFVTAVVGADLLTHNEAVRLAKQYMEAYRGAVLPGEVMTALVAAEFDTGASVGRAVYATEQVQVARRIAETDRAYDARFWKIVSALAVQSDRAAKNAGRETITESAEANGRRWRRVTDGNPCSFCAMLAGRGPVYRSEDSAGGVVGRNNYGTAAYRAGNVTYGGEVSRGARKGQDRTRGARGIGEHYHDRCGCTVEEALTGWEPTAKEAEFADLYERAVEACETQGVPANAKNVTAQMRRLGDGIVHDATKLAPEA